MTQRFNENDADEAAFIEILGPEIESIGQDLDDMFEGAATCFILGDVLYNTDRDPLVRAVSRAMYRTSFFAMHDLFTRPGTFEFYLDVFRAIFGPEAIVEFEIPGPGQLVINVPAAQPVTFNLAARRLVDGVYEYYNLVTSDTGDEIMGQGFLADFTEQELQNLINELAPNGIYTVVNLVVEE